MPLVSYCIPVYRPVYAKLLIDDLIRKTSCSYEILLWINVDDPDFMSFIEDRKSKGYPIEIVGVTPENIGMQAFKTLFHRASGEMFVQLDDDVVAVSRRAAEIAWDIFSKNKDFGVVGAHVWQDQWTAGGRPLLKYYTCVDTEQQLYWGPVDGGFTFYKNGLAPLVDNMRKAKYFALGVEMIGSATLLGLSFFLCPRIMMFHVNGPVYVNHYGMLDFEIKKYRALGRNDVASEYEAAKASLPDRGLVIEQILLIHHTLEVMA